MKAPYAHNLQERLLLNLGMRALWFEAHHFTAHHNASGMEANQKDKIKKMKVKQAIDLKVRLASSAGRGL